MLFQIVYLCKWVVQSHQVFLVLLVGLIEVFHVKASLKKSELDILNDALTNNSDMYTSEPVSMSASPLS